jgi:alkylated DNA repair dioxygenase AlkB
LHATGILGLEKGAKFGMTDLFDVPGAPRRNLLPTDGIAEYHGPVFDPAEADLYSQALMDTIPWRHDEALIYGKRIITQRQVAWYADNAYSYTYSGVTRTALDWSDTILTLKARVEQVSGERFNSCLLNLYFDGSVGMGWHSDAERDLVKNGAIASLSFGAERAFKFRHQTNKQTVAITLEHGALLIMKGTTQSHWLHSLPKAAGIMSPRINLTFRQHCMSN